MKIEQQFAEKLRGLHRKKGTIRRYVEHYKNYMRFIRDTRGRWISPYELNERDLEEWLNYLANERHVAPGTQNQAFFAICSLYKQVIGTELKNVSALRAKKNETLRTSISREQVALILSNLSGVGYAAALLMYSSGMRISEFCHLRCKDFDFDKCQIFIHCGKGGKDRLVQFPTVVHDVVRRQIESVRVLWKSDVAEGRNGVSLPYAYHRKSSTSRLNLGWYYFVPADQESRCPHTGTMLRHHKSQDAIRDMIGKGVQRSGILNRVTPHIFRHSYATHMLENGAPIHWLQQLMGHDDIRTTEGYLHLCKNSATSAKSPVEFLQTHMQSPSSCYRVVG